MPLSTEESKIFQVTFEVKPILFSQLIQYLQGPCGNKFLLCAITSNMMLITDLAQSIRKEDTFSDA